MEHVQASIDVQVDRLVTEGEEALHDAEVAYTMRSHAVVQQVDDMLQELGRKWTQAQTAKLQQQAEQQQQQQQGGPQRSTLQEYAAVGGPPLDPLGDPLRDPRARQPSSLFPRGPFGYTPGNPFEIGRGDFMPPGFPGPPSGGEGMLVGPHHPMFRARFPPPDRRGGGVPDMGIPRGSVPPGARFDPIHGIPPQPENPYANPRGPDFDEFPPPGNWGPNP